MGRNNPRPIEEETQAIDLTPMLDVVFIMLIFFIVTATFVKETGKDIVRPDATTSVDRASATILIAVGADNEIWIDKKRVDSRAVKATIERMRVDNPKGTVSIQADKNSDVKFLVEVANAAREAGISEVSVSTERN